MTRRATSVAFAALLLVVQLLLGAMAAGADPHQVGVRCSHCPPAQHHGTSPDAGTAGHDCTGHCAHQGAGGKHPSGCGSHCATSGGHHCGHSSGPALTSFTSFNAVVVNDGFGNDRGRVRLSDSPQFDFLRPPARG